MNWKSVPTMLFAVTTFTIALSAWTPVAHAQEVKLDGKVTSVTLHRNQAMVTREIEIDGEAGAKEIVVTNLPENVINSSLFAESDDTIEVRAVQYRTKAVGNSPREEVRKLNASIRTLQDAIELNQKNTELLKKQSDYLDKLEKFVAPTANVELTKGVLNAESLKELTQFSFEQRKSVLADQVKFAKEKRDLTEEMNLLQRKMAEITNGSSKTVREAVIFLQKNDAAKRKLRLNYLVGNCGWSPSYVIRAGQEKANVRLEYNGLIYQMTGENWENVELTLSTASPAISAAGPGLAPFKITLNQPTQSKQVAARNYQQQLRIQQNPKDELYSLFNKRKEALIANQKATNFSDNAATSWSINGFANDIACAALIGDESVVTTLRSQMEQMNEDPSLTYTIGSPINLTSRNTQQIVKIMQSDLPSKFYHVATPVLTSYVYREAELANDSDKDLLAGPISVYLEGKFVGRGEVPTVARGQSFVVGFGADPQLRSRREIVDRTEGVNGGNRELKFEYRFVVENFKNEAAQIRIIDRLPVSKDGSDIRITLASSESDLSDDKVYQRRERPEGILRWDIQAPAKAIGDNAKMLAYTYTVEYDRKFQITLPNSTAQLEQEFKQLQRGRSKR